MLIEIFTDGKVMVDGQSVGPTWQAEKVLYDYLTNPDKFAQTHLKKTG